MDLFVVALSEISLEGLEGVSINKLWELIDKRQPPVDCAIDQWTKPSIWEDIVLSEHIEFYAVDFNTEKRPGIPQNKKEERVAKKMPPNWINDYRTGIMGYCQSYFYRDCVTDVIRNEKDRSVKMTYIEAVEKWGDELHLVASQGCRQRILFGNNYPPIIEEVTAPRFIILEIIGRSRWEGFMQADFQRLFGMDSRTSFHHVKVLIQLHLMTKQSVLVKNNKNCPVGGKVEPPRCSKVLHLRQFSSVFTNQIQRTAQRICSILEEAPDQTIERNQLKEMCSVQDVTRFKKIRQWLFNLGYIQYIVNGEIWSHDNTNPIQLTHFRASRPCYVNLVKPFDAQDVDDDKDEFLDYIENCDDIEPQLVMEETLHSQAYQILLAVREKGITMKKLAEILCIPHYMARSVIRFFDTNKIGRLISVDHLKQKVQKIVAIQFLHESDTVQEIQSNKIKIEEHKKSDVKSELAIKQEGNEDAKLSTIKEMNLRLADNLSLTRVHEKSKVSLRPLARKNFILDALQKQPVYEGYNELYKLLVVSEDATKSTTGTCCRKTFRKIIRSLAQEKQLNEIMITIDETCIPPLQSLFICASQISEESDELKIIVDQVKVRHEKHIQRREMRYAATKKEPGSASKRKRSPSSSANNSAPEKSIKLEGSHGDSTTVDQSSEVAETETSLEKIENVDMESDTDDEEFAKSKMTGRYLSSFSKYFTYGRFQRLHVLHMFLWQLVYGTPEDLTCFEYCPEYMDLIKSQRMWLEHAHGLPTYSQGKGWFNVGDIISLMPLELTCRILGIKCWSNTAIKFLEDPKRRFTRMCDLPTRLKFKLLASTANKQHLDNCVDLLVLLAQMGLIAVPHNFYPKVRSEIMLYLRREAVITDTRYSEKGYCHIRLPHNSEEFPKTEYKFKVVKDLKSFWEDLQFICLNTPLGLSRITRSREGIPEEKELNKEQLSMGKAGINQTSSSKGLGRNYRSFTILRDFQSYYENKDFNNMEPNVFGNGLGAGGLDSIFFAHLVKNWRTGDTKQPKQKPSKKPRTTGAAFTGKEKTKETWSTASDPQNDVTKKIIIPNSIVKKKKGGKGLKRTQLASKIVMTKKMKMDRKKKFDQLIAKRFDTIREKIKQREVKRKTLRKSKRVQQAMNHDETDREALRLMKGLRVSFTEREDAYILLADIVRNIMNLSAKGQPLEKEHPKILWRAIRDILHKDIPESKDKTWNAINRRARYIKKYPHSLIVYKTCMAELEQNKDFMGSIKCTKDNWKEKLNHFFNATREIYSRHFNQPVTLDGFPSTFEELFRDYEVDYADKEKEDESSKLQPRTEKSIRTNIIRDLVHNAMIAQRSSAYKPSLAFKLFDVYTEEDVRKAFEHFKKNRLVSRLRCDLPRSRSLPVTTMTYTLSSQTYDRIFEPPMPLKMFSAARCFYFQLRDGKKHTGKCAEKDLSRLPVINQHGFLHLDYSELQAGHVAYLLSAMMSRKIVLDFTLNDEMIVADEEHMKKLQKGSLNFQRVAFQQRVLKGRNMKRLSQSSLKNSTEEGETGLKSNTDEYDTAEESDHAPSLMSNSSRPVGASEDVTGKMTTVRESGVTPSQVSESESTGGAKARKSDNTPSDCVIDDGQEPCCSKSLPKNDTGRQDDDVMLKRVDSLLRKHDVISIEDKEGKQSENEISSDSKNSNSTSTATKRDVKKPATDKRRVTFSNSFSEHGTVRGTVEEYLGTSQQFLNGHFYKLSNNDPCTSYVSEDLPDDLQSARAFTYSTLDQIKSKPNPSIDYFKETKLFASRTSLAMHRSLNFERLDPMNAMNTHDALVINPMGLNINLVTSPFRAYFSKTKVKHSEKETELWKRIKDSNAINDVIINRLTPGEYSEILKEELSLEANLVEEHLKLLEEVKKHGNIGMDKQSFKTYCRTSLPLFHEDFKENVQH
eukprot:TCONS_00070164-protein